jgi:hypothetical protein
VIYDAIVTPPRRARVPAWARRARGPGGVVSDENGVVTANVLQQDLDSPPRPGPIPVGVDAAAIRERPKG